MIDKIWTLNKPYIVAEVAQNHDGSLGQAHAFIDAVSEAGADAIKFQTHIADEESTIYEPFRVNFSYEDRCRYDYWKRMEFTKEQWRGLYEHASDVGLDFLSSPFSVKALEMLDSIGVGAWKFGSGEVFNEALLDKAIETGKPILLSTGLSTYNEIDEQVQKIREKGNKFVLFQCVTAYPSTADMIDIELIPKFIERYQCKVGISDHSATIFPSLAAVTLGAMVVEVHVTMSPYMFGPDVKASVDMKQLKQIVQGATFIAQMKSANVNMNIRTAERNNLKEMFSKSLYAVTDLPKGTDISPELFAAKKPNIAIDANDLKLYVGKKIKNSIKKDNPLKMEDIDLE